MSETPTILVIDDDKRLVDLIQDCLQSYGYNVLTALDGQFALPLALSKKPDLIIMDVDMPVVNGIDALRQLRKHPKTSQLPVIMLTGVVSDQVYPIIESMPAVSHVKKPVALEDLLSMVHVYLPEGR